MICMSGRGKRRWQRSVWLTVAGSAVVVASAQTPLGRGGGGSRPFFGGPAPVVFNPEPAATWSGHSLMGAAVVSPDRKYVQLNMAPSQMSVTGVQTFPVYANGGFVGSGVPGGPVAGRGRNQPDPGIAGPQAEPPPLMSTAGPLTGVLAAEGMTRVSGAD